MNTSPMHAGFTGPRFEPIAEPLRGFRAWLIEDSVTEATDEFCTRGFVGGSAQGRLMRGSLHGVFCNDYVWGSSKNAATCLRPVGWGFGIMGTNFLDKIPAHDQVIEECDCGFWAYTTGEHYISVPGPAALGVVEAWGRIVIGPLGFRASHARILGLTFPDSDKSTSAVSTLERLARVKHPWKNVAMDLRAAVRRLYPKVTYCDTVAELQAKFPLSNTKALLTEELDA